MPATPNPYESPRSPTDEEPIPAGDPVRRELARLRALTLPATVVVVVAAVALLAGLLAGLVRRHLLAPLFLLPVVSVALGAGVLTWRLLLFARTVRTAAADAFGLDDCFRDLRKVLSQTGTVIATSFAVSWLLWLMIRFSR